MIIELYSNDNQQTNNFASDYLKKNHFGKIISLDVGKKRIGIAVCDENRLICTPKLIINRLKREIDELKNQISLASGEGNNIDLSELTNTEIEKLKSSVLRFIYDYF